MSLSIRPGTTGDTGTAEAAQAATVADSSEGKDTDTGALLSLSLPPPGDASVVGDAVETEKAKEEEMYDGGNNVGLLRVEGLSHPGVLIKSTPANCSEDDVDTPEDDGATWDGVVFEPAEDVVVKLLCLICCSLITSSTGCWC